MRCTAPLGLGAGDPGKLMPADRARQKGAPGCRQFLAQPFQGTGFTRKTKVILFLPCATMDSGWVEAAFEYQQQHRAGDDVPYVAFCSTTQDASVQKEVHDQMKDLVLKKWWNVCSEDVGATL